MNAKDLDDNKVDIDGLENLPEPSLSPHSPKIPEIVPVLPIRRAVAFPGTVIPLAIGRKRSKALIDTIVPQETVIALVTQKNPDVENPGPDDLYPVGTAVSVLKVMALPHGTLNVIVHGLTRVRIDEYTAAQPYLQAAVTTLKTTSRLTKKFKALMLHVKEAAARVIELSPNIPDEAAVMLDHIEEPSALADFLAAGMNMPVEEKQTLLEELKSHKRLETLSVFLANQLEVLELSQKIQGKVRESVDKSQREYYLHEELKAIQAELGQADRHSEEIDKLTAAVKAAGMPEPVENEILKELDRLAKTPAASPDFPLLRNYIEWAAELPWAKESDEQLDICKAERILNRDHYGLKKIKRRILEFLAVRVLNPAGKSPILCFVGPPGVGKTSLGQSIARAMGRKFVRISLGGIRDEADIRGHRRTYIGALPGRILQELRKCETRNPVFMLDELDKIGQDFRGDPASALLEVLDPQQNNTFSDHYLDQPFDLSRVLFIGTANYTEPIPPALLDRMEVIELPGYTAQEKLNIAKRYLVPRQLAEHGLTKDTLTIEDDAIQTLITGYTREAGVRNLERRIASVCRWVAVRIAKKQIKSDSIHRDRLKEILGPVTHESELALRTAAPGVATGLAYTPAGGQILFIEAARMAGKGRLELTGHIGQVMKESAHAAMTVVKSMAGSLGLDEKSFTETDFHVHVPAGAVPKDGPSAGVAIFTSLASLLTGRPVHTDLAMTGEITLRGLVLPIGGLKEKVLAAKQAGIKRVLLPERNRKDMHEVPAEAKRGLRFIYVKNAQAVLKNALEISRQAAGKS